MFASVPVLSEVKDAHNDLNQKGMFYELSPKLKHGHWRGMRYLSSNQNARFHSPIHTFSSALNAVKRNMFVLGLRMFLIESFPGFLECTTEKKILHKLLHAKTNLPLGAHIFVSRVCTYSAQCTHCPVHIVDILCTLGRVQCIVYCEWAFWPPPDIGLGIDVQG